MVLILLTLRFFIFDLYIIIKSIDGQYCPELEQSGSKTPCSITVSGYNLKSGTNQKDLDLVDILGFIFTLFMIAYFIAFRKILNNFRKYSRAQQFADNNFSILV
jgi:hypothetical protein